MRTKNFTIGLTFVILFSVLLIIWGPNGQQNGSIKSIVSQTHQQLREFRDNIGATSTEKKLDVDTKYLSLLGFTQIIYNGTKLNFSIVSYVQNGQAASAILLAQNVAIKLPQEQLLIYDLGLSLDDSHALNAFCNNSKCTVILYDLSQFSTIDDRQHTFRPLIIKDALTRSKTILFIENNIRIHGSTKDINMMRLKAENGSGVLGWVTRQAVSSRTHPKMFEYFDTEMDFFLFLPMVSMDVVFFVDTVIVNEKILLPWIKCTLTQECIHPIGAQSGGCKYNKKPQYRYSGCHNHDVSAFNIVLGVTWGFDEKKYSVDEEEFIESKLFIKETLEQATKILENKRKNISDTSEHPFTDD